MTTYLGFDVLDQVTPGREEAAKVFKRSFTLLDNRTGKRAADDRGGAPIVTRPFTWIAHGRAAINTFKSFITARKGRAVPFWVPTYQHDLILNQDVLATETTIVIKDINYTAMLFPNAARRHIAYITPALNMTFRKITSATRTTTTETLTMDSAAGTAFPASTTMVAFLILCRLAEDKVEYTWYTTDYIEAALKFTELPKEATA